MKTDKERNYAVDKEEFLKTIISDNKTPLSNIVDNFSKYVSRQQLSRFLVRHELFKKVLNVKGSIVECGLFAGDGLMSWAQLSAIYEPFNYHREIIGFDTFEGFPHISEEDMGSGKNENAVVGGLYNDSYKELTGCIDLYDQNRVLSHISKIKLIKGDFIETGRKYIEDNKHLLISLLYMDFDTYKPTKEALELFLPRMSKGAILAFDQINNPDWPGETLALLEELNLRKSKIEQFCFDPNMSYIVL